MNSKESMNINELLKCNISDLTNISEIVSTNDLTGFDEYYGY